MNNWWDKYLHFWQKRFVKTVYFEMRKAIVFPKDLPKDEWLVVEFKNGTKYDSPMELSPEGSSGKALKERFEMIFWEAYHDKIFRVKKKQEIEEIDYKKYTARRR